MFVYKVILKFLYKALLHVLTIPHRFIFYALIHYPELMQIFFHNKHYRAMFHATLISILIYWAHLSLIFYTLRKMYILVFRSIIFEFIHNFTSFIVRWF